MNKEKQKLLINSYLADFHASCLQHSDDLSKPVTYDDFDKTIDNLVIALNKCFANIIDNQIE